MVSAVSAIVPTLNLGKMTLCISHSRSEGLRLDHILPRLAEEPVSSSCSAFRDGETLAISKAPGDRKRPQFAHRSLCFVGDPNPKSPQKGLDGKDEPFNDNQRKRLQELLAEGRPLVENGHLEPAGKHIIPFIDFEECLPDNVPVGECVLHTSGGKVQYFPKK